MRGTLFLAVVMAAYSVTVGPLLLPLCDAWWHLAQVNHLVQSGGWFPRGPDGRIFPNAGLWHGVLASLCRVTNTPSLRLWIVLAPVIAFVLVLVSGWLAGVLIGPRWRAAGALGFCLLFEGTHLDVWREVCYPRYVNLIPLLLALGNAVLYVRTGAGRPFLIAILLGALLAVVHLIEFVLFGFLLGFWCVALLWFRPREIGRVLVVGLCSLVLASPYLVGVLSKDVPDLARAAGGIQQPAERLRDIVFLSKDLYLLDPGGEFGAILTSAGWVCLLAVPLLFSWARSDPAGALLVGATVGPPFLVLNPLLLPAFLRHWPAPEVLHRLALAMLVPFVAAALVQITIRRRNVSDFVYLVVFTLALFPVVRFRVGGLFRPGWSDELRAVQPLAPALPLLLQEPAPILTDPFTGHLVAAFTGQPPVDQGPRWDANVDRRVRGLAFRFFRDPCMTSQEITKALRDASVGWVVVNQVPLPKDYWVDNFRDAYYDARTLAFLTANPSAFKRRFDINNLTVFQVVDTGGPFTGKDLPVATRRQELLRPAGARHWQPAGAGVELAADRITVQRGAVHLELACRFQVPTENDLKLAVHLLNPHYPSRLVRKALEWMTGRIHRFGSGTDLVPESHQVLPMRPGDVITLAVDVPVPKELAEGSYQISAQVLQKGPDGSRVLELVDRLPGARLGEVSLPAKGSP